MDGSSAERCSAEDDSSPPQGPIVESVGVYRCESNQVTVDQSRMALIHTGIDVKSSYCVYLRIPDSVTAPGSEACEGAKYTEADIHHIPIESVTDALAVKDYDFRVFEGHEIASRAGCK